MKHLQIKALSAAVLLGGSLLGSGTAMAMDTTAGAGVSTTPGTGCKAYVAANESKLTPGWSTLTAKSGTWVHCTGEGNGIALTAATGAAYAAATPGTIRFNMTIPVDALTDVYSCYLASQTSTAGSSTKVATWGQGSNAGTVPVTITAPGLTTPLTPLLVSYTSGCFLAAQHQLHSVAVTTGAL